MIIAISSIVLLIFFLVIVNIEKRYSEQANKTLKKTNKVLEDLESRVERKYRDKFGKDPTGKIPLLDKDEDK